MLWLRALHDRTKAMLKQHPQTILYLFSPSILTILGNSMKVFKQNNKLTIYISPDVAKELGIEEGDEVDFFKYSDKSFLFMKKSDVANLLMGSTTAPQPVVQKANDYLDNEELSVLRKLDTLRYPQRTKEKINEILDSQEKVVLQQLVKKKMVGLFKKNNVELYSISKDVYDKFLMRKKPVAQTEKQVTVQQREAKPSMPKVQLSGHIEGPYASYVRTLEENGFLVVQTEAEAGGVSLALENSIRRGQVLGTRSFNKKFYIVTRQFFDMHNPSITKAMRDGISKVGEIAEKASMSEDAARAILYLLAENGDVREKRKDSFALA